jgi:hypothetical protein
MKVLILGLLLTLAAVGTDSRIATADDFFSCRTGDCSA